MDLYQVALVCSTILLGLLIISVAMVACFRIFVRFEERNSIREQEVATHKARMYAEKDISKAYLENMANTFGMYPPENTEISESGYDTLLRFIGSPEGQGLIEKLGINLNKEPRA